MVEWAVETLGEWAPPKAKTGVPGIVYGLAGDREISVIAPPRRTLAGSAPSGRCRNRLALPREFPASVRDGK